MRVLTGDDRRYLGCVASVVDNPERLVFLQCQPYPRRIGLVHFVDIRYARGLGLRFPQICIFGDV